MYRNCKMNRVIVILLLLATTAYGQWISEIWPAKDHVPREVYSSATGTYTTGPPWNPQILTNYSSVRYKDLWAMQCASAIAERVSATEQLPDITATSLVSFYRYQHDNCESIKTQLYYTLRWYTDHTQMQGGTYTDKFYTAPIIDSALVITNFTKETFLSAANLPSNFFNDTPWRQLNQSSNGWDALRRGIEALRHKPALISSIRSAGGITTTSVGFWATADMHGGTTNCSSCGQCPVSDPLYGVNTWTSNDVPFWGSGPTYDYQVDVKETYSQVSTNPEQHNCSRATTYSFADDIKVWHQYARFTNNVQFYFKWGNFRPRTQQIYEVSEYTTNCSIRRPDWEVEVPTWITDTNLNDQYYHRYSSPRLNVSSNNPATLGSMGVRDLYASDVANYYSDCLAADETKEYERWVVPWFGTTPEWFAIVEPHFTYQTNRLFE
jgi:hypothetical protein